MVDEKIKGYVRIKLANSPEKPDNKSNGFYILMTNGNTYSDVKDEFVVEEKFLILLDEADVDYIKV